MDMVSEQRHEILTSKYLYAIVGIRKDWHCTASIRTPHFFVSLIGAAALFFVSGVVVGTRPASGSVKQP